MSGTARLPVLTLTPAIADVGVGAAEDDIDVAVVVAARAESREEVVTGGGIMRRLAEGESSVDGDT